MGDHKGAEPGWVIITPLKREARKPFHGKFLAL